MSKGRNKENQSPFKPMESLHKELTTSCEKFCDTILHKDSKDIPLLKKLETEKKKARELYSQNAVQIEKIKQLEIEVETVRKSLLLQIEMYKQMMREQDDEKSRHVRSLQSAYNCYIQRLLQEYDAEKKLLEQYRVEMDNRCKVYYDKIERLNYYLSGVTIKNKRLQQYLENNLKNNEKIQQEMYILYKKQQELRYSKNKEIYQLQQHLTELKYNHQRQEEATVYENNRKIEELRKIHSMEVQKLESRRDAELLDKSTYLRYMNRLFEQYAKKLQEIINQKDRYHSIVMSDLRRYKYTSSMLGKQLTESVRHNELLMAETKRKTEYKDGLSMKCKELYLAVKTEISKKYLALMEYRMTAEKDNIDLVHEVDRLKKYLYKLKRELADNEKVLLTTRNESKEVLSLIQVDADKIKKTSEELVDENKHLRSYIKNLKGVLLYSSVEMEKCKQEFIKMAKEKERLTKLSRNNEEENIRIRAVLAEKDLESRHNRSQYASARLRN